MDNKNYKLVKEISTGWGGIIEPGHSVFLSEFSKHNFELRENTKCYIVVGGRGNGSIFMFDADQLDELTEELPNKDHCSYCRHFLKCLVVTLDFPTCSAFLSSGNMVSV